MCVHVKSSKSQKEVRTRFSTQFYSRNMVFVFIGVVVAIAAIALNSSNTVTGNRSYILRDQLNISFFMQREVSCCTGRQNKAHVSDELIKKCFYIRLQMRV